MALSSQRSLNPDLGALVAIAILAPVAFFTIHNVRLDAKMFLLTLCSIASMTGVCSTWLSIRLNRPRHVIVRDGCKGSLIGSVACAGLLVAFCRFFQGFMNGIMALVAVVPSILPAAFCGMMAAGLTVIALNPPQSVEGSSAGGSRLGMLVAVFIAVLGFLSPLMPASPGPPPRPVEQSQHVFVPAPQPVSVPVEPAFHYEVPNNFKSATAAEISIVARKNYGRIEARSPIVISGGSRFLAFRPATNQGMLEVVDLHRQVTVGRFSPGGNVGSMSFSPDGKRLICDMPSAFIRLVVIDVESGRITPLPMPKGRALPAGGTLWWEENEVLLFSRDKSDSMLNLQSLLVADADQSSRWKNLPKAQQDAVRESGLAAFTDSTWQFRADEKLISAELPETQGTAGWNIKNLPQWAIEDKLKPFANLSIDIVRGNEDRVLIAPDHAKVVLVQGDLLLVLYLGATNPPPLVYSVEMHHKPGECEDAGTIRNALETDDLSALIYAPMINPLNGKVVGPDRGRIKARVRFAKWDGEKARVWVQSLFQLVASGDIIADVHVFSSGDVKPLAVERAHPWWTTLDDKSAEADGVIPSNEELAKLRDASVPSYVKLPASALKLQTPLFQLPSSPSPLVMSTPSSPAKAPDAQNINGKEIRAFVLAHHKKATDGNIAGMVADYADKVDHFNNGIVNRDFILKDEIDYHSKYIFVDEEVKGEIKAKPLPNGAIELSYLLLVSWQKRANNELGSSECDVSLELVNAAGGPQIVKHRSVKRNP